MPPPRADALAAVPAPRTQRLAVRVTPAARRALLSSHPWVFDGAISGCRPQGAHGDLAVVFDERRRFLAIGLYDPASPIRIRVLAHREPTPIDEGFFRNRLRTACAKRAALLQQTDTTACRLVHGENDALPGMVIDRYADVLVLKLYTAAWIPWLPTIRAALADVVAHEALVLRLDRATAASTDALHGLQDGTTIGGTLTEDDVDFREDGLAFAADVRRGHKTGFFLDQRENRARVRGLADGRRALDVFAYTGAFSVYAAAGGARDVISVDSSRPALAAARRHFARNRDVGAVAAARHAIRHQDAFGALADLAQDGASFSLVIVDPPALAKRASEVQRALLAYERLTRLALDVLAPAGILVSSSCSSRVNSDAFHAAVLRAAARAGRPLREICRTGHPADHPVAFPEGAYLKCLFAQAP